MRSLCILFLVAAFSSTGYAVPDSLKRSVAYYNTFTSGMMIGCGDCLRGKDLTATFSMSHGIVFPSGIRLAAGTGLDVYSEWRMIPLVAGFTWDKQKRSNGLYFHLNSGYAFGQYLRPDQGSFFREEERGGFTVNPMIGYRIGREKLRVYLQAGYKYQQAYYALHYDGGRPGIPSYSIERDYQLQRLVVQLGFGFN
ncbi:MAG: hypothetical protein MUE95_15710 [Cyclobacteriaceae bacterium]|jgi:hypothetical protein|nr:hypothetical protein [Cyclobacteriaceae bacterium]